jgi:hypothetical protein
MYVCMYICVCMCVCTYVCVYVRMYVYICVYLCMCVCTYVCVYVFMSVYMYLSVCRYVCVYVSMYVYVCGYVYVHMYAFVCVYSTTLSTAVTKCGWITAWPNNNTPDSQWMPQWPNFRHYNRTCPAKQEKTVDVPVEIRTGHICPTWDISATAWLNLFGYTAEGILFFSYSFIHQFTQTCIRNVACSPGC